MFLIRDEVSENRCGVGLDGKFHVELGGGKVVAQVEVHSCARTTMMLLLLWLMLLSHIKVLK